ncbi:MAG: hypothetical protein IJA34_11575 [Lachnospiraceae bacterium]|nr:hypothetical protein [Lachnospiraceae bacterium]
MIFLISGIILKTEVEDLEEKFNETCYIEARDLMLKYEITDKNLINAIIQELGCLKVKKRHPFKEFISDSTTWISPNKDAFRIKGYDSKNGNKLFELTIRSNDYMEIDGDEYKIKTDTCIYDILDCYAKTRCLVELPIVEEDNILEFSLQGEIEYSKDDIVKKYQEVRKSKIITEEEFEYSDSYISIKTSDEEFIDIYFVGDRIFTRCRKDKFDTESLKKVKDKYGDIISEWETGYYVLN